MTVFGPRLQAGHNRDEVWEVGIETQGITVVRETYKKKKQAQKAFDNLQKKLQKNPDMYL